MAIKSFCTLYRTNKNVNRLISPVRSSKVVNRYEHAHNRDIKPERQDVLFEKRNNAGVIILNRPKSLNVLNYTILSQLLPKLWEWEKSKNIVIIKGNGKSFCAGGDVKDVAKIGQTVPFSVVEYNINHLIGNYKIPYVALLDGVAMGGGLGVSVHGRYRIATENSVIAMPEVKIGLIPDVGGTYFLPRLPFHIGIYLGLTSNVLIGKDVAAVCVATHYVSANRLAELETALSHCETDDEVKATINKFHEPIEKPFSLSPHVKDIDFCFSAQTVEEIIRRLNQVNNEWATDTIKTMRRMSPLSLKITLRALQRGANLSLWQCLHMEHRLCRHLSITHNFKEGLRALLIDKDNNPQWIPKTIEEVNDSDIEPYFGPSEAGDLIYLSPKL